MKENLATVIMSCFEEAYNSTLNFIKLHNHSQKEMEEAVWFFINSFKYVVDRKVEEKGVKSND